MDNVRAKFRCTELSPVPVGVGGSRYVALDAVYQGDSPDAENTKFWNATPSGKLSMSITNPAAFNQFELGAEYYIDITPAPKTAA